jgi:DNA-directed RNA polymerase subunit RPC12/RpoP
MSDISPLEPPYIKDARLEPQEGTGTPSEVGTSSERLRAATDRPSGQKFVDRCYECGRDCNGAWTEQDSDVICGYCAAKIFRDSAGG